MITMIAGDGQEWRASDCDRSGEQSSLALRPKMLMMMSSKVSRSFSWPAGASGPSARSSQSFASSRSSTSNQAKNTMCHLLFLLLTTTTTISLLAARCRAEPAAAQLDRLAAEFAPTRAPSQPASRLNELDAFLDEMDHSELRQLAAGRHLSASLFQPKALESVEAPAAAAQTAAGERADGQQIYSECALILQRTYVKSLDHPKHQLVPFGRTEQACISYKHIDKAVEQAKQQLRFREQLAVGKRTRVAKPIELLQATLEPPEELVAAVGELNMAATQILASQFELSSDELLNGLPLIDMSKTSFWPWCPRLVRQEELRCKPADRFRTHTGHCNNLRHPSWGAAMTPFARYLPPVHPDGVWAPRKSIVTETTFELTQGHRETSAEFGAHKPLFPQPADGEQVAASSEHQLRREQVAASSESQLRREQVAASSERQLRRQLAAPQELPGARLVTSVVHRDLDAASHDFSILFMSWGQLLDHDMTRAAQPPSSIKCCEPLQAGQQRHKLCLPIGVPQGDPFYGQHGVRCLEFRRSLAGVRPNCVLGPRVHQNAITAPIDANFVYGSSRAQADGLRAFRGGRLRERDWFAELGLKPLLPAQEEQPDLECIGRPKDLFCFLAGDVRANEQTHLTVLHTIYLREHNRIADKLQELNPHWDDERTYQETRHLVAAGVQHVMLTEYLPLLIGKKMSELYNLTGAGAGADHYWHGYDPSVTTSVSNSFAAAAFRQGHTFVQGSVERYDKQHQLVASQKLRHLFKRPFLLYQPGVLDELLGGLLNQPAQGYDPFISEDISGHLFQPPELSFGHDLAAINLQRGREQALPGYNLFREWCGLPRAETFHQLEPYLTNHTAFHYSRLYKHVDDIDLWSGGVSERKLPGAAIGPTFACIIARQFSNTRRGDRFWYENPSQPSSFTRQQLAEIRKVSLARLLCSNADELPTVQRWALRMPHPVLNPRLPCSQLPEPDLRYWQEE